MGGSIPSVLLPRGIRSGILLSLLLVAGLAGMAVLAVVLVALQVGNSVETTVGRRLPIALESLSIARQADRLVLAAGPLVASSNEAERAGQWRTIEGEMAILRSTAQRTDAQEANPATLAIAPIAERLVTSLSRLDEMVRERIELVEAQRTARAQLANTISMFQHQTLTLSRILAGDAAVLRRHITRDDVRQRVMIREMAQLVPVARLETLVSFLDSKLMSISDIPTQADLATATTIIAVKLDEVQALFSDLDASLASPLVGPLTKLHQLAQGEDGILALHQAELRLVADIANLTRETEAVARELDLATWAQVTDSRAGVSRALEQMAEAKTTSLLVFFLVALVTLSAIGLVMHFYVNRYLLRRLTWVSEAMLAVADGRFDAALPPEGHDELGRLGMAVRTFRDTALQAQRREIQLSALNAKAERTLADLKTAQGDLIRQARTDFLTGLANRQSFMETAQREWERAGRDNEHVGILMLDLDNFKAINDRHGHQTGDKVLQRAAAICSATLRPTDLLGRVGGEEFAALLPGAPLAGCVEAAERIREAVASARISDGDGNALHLTVSIGVAARSEQGLSLDGALARADAALYSAKHAGRNRVMTAADPAPSPSPSDSARGS